MESLQPETPSNNPEVKNSTGLTKARSWSSRSGGDAAIEAVCTECLYPRHHTCIVCVGVLNAFGMPSVRFDDLIKIFDGDIMPSTLAGKDVT